MKKAYLVVRSALLWVASGIHFAVVCTFLVFLGIFIDPRKNDRPQRLFFRNILRVGEVRGAPLARLRSETHQHFHLQSRQHL
jgi:hypothetical protein